MFFIIIGSANQSARVFIRFMIEKEDFSCTIMSIRSQEFLNIELKKLKFFTSTAKQENWADHKIDTAHRFFTARARRGTLPRLVLA